MSSIYTTRFTPLQFDAQNHDELVKASRIVFENCDRVAALINNAGIAIPGPLELLTEEEMQLDVNVKSVRRITNLFLPLLNPKQTNKQVASSISAQFQGYSIRHSMAHTAFQSMPWKV